MKIYLAVFAAIFLLKGYTCADDMRRGDTYTKNETRHARKRHKMKDCLAMENGQMIIIKNGKKMTMDTDMGMPNGTLVMKDGTCMLKNGSKISLKEGDRMDMNGNMMDSNYYQ